MLRNLFDFMLMPFRAMYVAVTQPEKILQIPGKLARISAPVGIALIVFVFLLVSVITYYVAAARLNASQQPYWAAWWQSWPVVAALVVIIPLVTYALVRAFLEGETSRHEDITRCWNLGLAELERHGIDLRQTPVFLVLGLESPTHADRVFKSTQISFVIRGAPEGNMPLRWYANHDAIYIACLKAGVLSFLASDARQKSDEALPQGDLRSNIDRESAPEPVDVRLTVAAATAQAQGKRLQEVDLSRAYDIQGTITHDQLQAQMRGAAPTSQGVDRSSVHLLLKSDDRREQRERLEYLCWLLRRFRAPIVPINGVMTLYPLTMLEADNIRGDTVRDATRDDTGAVLDVLQTRCPTVALVTGMEEERGFLEFVKRYGLRRAQLQRIGKSLNPWDLPESEQLSLVARHAVALVETSVYEQFKDKEKLGSTGNRHMYSLLCKLRGQVVPRLETVLGDGFGFSGLPEEKLLFLGCYFGASGPSEDQRGFVQSVFDKLSDLQGDLAWSQRAKRSEARRLKIAYAGIGIDLTLAAALGFLLLRRFFTG